MSTELNSKNIDVLNGLMLVLSFLVAIILPFDTFLFSYAVLGPLHYLTELHWLKKKNFFLPNQNKPYKIVFIIGLLLIPVIILALSFLYFGVQIKGFYGVVLMLFFLISSLFLYVFESKKAVLVFIFLLIVVALIYFTKIGFLVFLGVFLPTMIHVYFFTGFFMLMGYFKSPNTISLATILLLFFVPILIYFLPVEDLVINISEKSQKIYNSTDFKGINDWFVFVFGVENDKKVSFLLKAQIFIAFAYTFHYLNWFSKTSVIGWSKNLGLKKGVLVLAIWILSIALYLYNYQLGLTVLFVLSMMHVLAEFPLNALSIKTIVQKIKEK